MFGSLSRSSFTREETEYSTFCPPQPAVRKVAPVSSSAVAVARGRAEGETRRRDRAGRGIPQDAGPGQGISLRVSRPFPRAAGEAIGPGTRSLIADSLNEQVPGGVRRERSPRQ